jgi:hypothetical protein
MGSIITLPVAVHNDTFKWQLSLFWFGHRRTYGLKAAARTHAILIDRNLITEPKAPRMAWGYDIPHTLCESICDSSRAKALTGQNMRLAVPLNIQIGLSQVLDRYDDDQLLEVTDCDMVHFRPCPIIDVPAGELYVSTVYEDWHLFSLSSERHIIEPYFENGGKYYNGGFVPIVGRASTFRRILPEWINVHIDILNRPYPLNPHWWAGMYALQAACEKTQVQMVAKDTCYVPAANQLRAEHYIGHYCVDHVFDKRTYPQEDVSRFPANPYYDLIKEWLLPCK